MIARSVVVLSYADFCWALKILCLNSSSLSRSVGIPRYRIGLFKWYGGNPLNARAILTPAELETIKKFFISEGIEFIEDATL